MTDPRLNQTGRYQDLYREVIDYNQRMSGEWRSVSDYLNLLMKLLIGVPLNLYNYGFLLFWYYH